MDSFFELGLKWYDYLIILGIGIVVFIITYIIYPPIIKWLKQKGYIGYDIHKKDRPATAESGGLGLTAGIIIGLLLVGVFYPMLWNEVIIFIITIIIAAIVGWIDDRTRLSSLKKILLMFITGLPIFIANIYFIKFIEIESPTLPILGRLQLNIIYPLVVPFIIMVLTNTVNMLEGYNGEGSGTTSIATFFMIICAIILESSQGLIFGVVVFAAIFAFFLFNKYPAKAFPGDIGTLVIGAAIGSVGIFGSIESIMVLVILPQVFNSFYVIASERGFKESHTIKTPDIWLDEDEYINPSDEPKAALTLPRLIVLTGKLNEKDLVNHFLVLSFISGLFAIIATQLMIPAYEFDIFRFLIILATCIIVYCIVILKYRRLMAISIVMILILTITCILVFIIDRLIVEPFPKANWLLGGFVGLIILIFWYGITILYFNKTLEKQKKNPNFTSFHEKTTHGDQL